MQNFGLAIVAYGFLGAIGFMGALEIGFRLCVRYA